MTSASSGRRDARRKATTLALSPGRDAAAAARASARLPPATGLCCASDPARRGGGAPIASAPYYATDMCRVMARLGRNRTGNRVHHVARFVATLETDPRRLSTTSPTGRSSLSRFELRTSAVSQARAALHVQPGGQFFAKPGKACDCCAGEPCSQENSRSARPSFAKSPGAHTDQGPVSARPPTITSAGLPGFRGGVSTRSRANLRKQSNSPGSHALAQGCPLHARLAGPVAGARSSGEPRELGLDVERVQQPPGVHFSKVARPAWDIADVGWGERRRIINPQLDVRRAHNRGCSELGTCRAGSTGYSRLSRSVAPDGRQRSGLASSTSCSRATPRRRPVRGAQHAWAFVSPGSAAWS